MSLIHCKVSVISAGNSVQAYITTKFTARVYSPGTVTPLASRTFGTWTFLSAVIRMYAAYNITDQMVYQLALWTYVIALVHFASEWLYFESAIMGKGLLSPMIIASGTLAWMVTQWEFYSMGGWTIQLASDAQ